MPRLSEPVKQVCYADDITVWASGVQLPVLEDCINDYLEEITAFIRENLLPLSAPKSTVTLFTPNTKQDKNHPRIVIEDKALPLVQSPKILGSSGHHTSISQTLQLCSMQASTKAQ